MQKKKFEELLAENHNCFIIHKTVHQKGKKVTLLLYENLKNRINFEWSGIILWR